MAKHGPHSSSFSSSRQYDVFLSFRGEDTRKQFIDHLCHSLDFYGVRNITGDDDYELLVGSEIGPALFTAIEQSTILIPVLSKNFASSRCCLQELVKMLQCYKTSDQIVLPIFFDIQRSDVRNQTESFGEAFRKHKERLKPEIFNEWKVALKEVGELRDWILKEVGNGDNSQLVQLVVQEVLRKLNKTPSTDVKHPVELYSHVKYLLSLLNLKSMDPQFVGIYGIGGIGKTTIAKAVYRQIFESFNGSSFLTDVREEASKYNGLICLQNQLLNDILGKQSHNISHVDRGSKLIEKRLREKKVLLVLDDVDHHLQLNALAGELSWFGSGSRIIITTRDEQVLSGIQVDDNNIYKPKQLDIKESLQLFSMHAFGRNQPPEDYLQLSRAMVRYAGGLPLILEVLGSSLCNVGKHEVWTSALQKLKNIPLHEIQEKLKISYDELDDIEKALFLDIACFFIGMDKELAFDIWKACGYYPVVGLKELIQKSLIRIDEDNELRMHDQLRDMGRQIVYEECPMDPGERSRLWSCEEIMKVLKEYKGTRKVKGILPHSGWGKGNCFKIEDFARMSNLRLLQVNGVDLEGDIKDLPSRLVWLCWQYCPLEILPSNFYMDKLVVLDLSYSRIKQAWDELQYMRFENLKILNLSHCLYLAKSPDFTGFPQLEKLILENCTALVNVHESIGKLERLVHLNLSGCIKLMELPCSICNLFSLHELILSGCYQVKKLPESIGDLIYLVELKLDNTRIHELPNSIGMLSTLRYLSLIYCRSLTRIPDSIGSMKSLVELYMEYMLIAEIPDAIVLLKKLEILHIQHCPYIEVLPMLPSSLICLYASECVSLERLPDLSNLKNLRTLRIINCEKLAKITGLEGAESLEELVVIGCVTLTDTLPEVFVQVLPSPTTGTVQPFNWKSNSIDYQKDVKKEERNYPDFIFQPQTKPAMVSGSMFQTSATTMSMEETLRGQWEAWNFQEPTNHTDSAETIMKSDIVPSHSYSPKISPIQANTQANEGFHSDFNQYPQPSQIPREERSDDGYNWRKCEEKLLKGSENLHSYYKCAFANCPTTKKVERSLDGHFTKILYEGLHNHPEPQSVGRSSTSAVSTPEISDQSHATSDAADVESVANNSDLDDDFDCDGLYFSTFTEKRQ